MKKAVKVKRFHLDEVSNVPVVTVHSPFEEEEAESVLNAIHLLRIINKTPSKMTPRWTHFRDREKAEGRDPNPVEFMKTTYKEWYEAGVLYAGMIHDCDKALSDALFNY